MTTVAIGVITAAKVGCANLLPSTYFPLSKSQDCVRSASSTTMATLRRVLWLAILSLTILILPFASAQEPKSALTRFSNLPIELTYFDDSEVRRFSCQRRTDLTFILSRLLYTTILWKEMFGYLRMRARSGSRWKAYPEATRCSSLHILMTALWYVATVSHFSIAKIYHRRIF